MFDEDGYRRRKGRAEDHVNAIRWLCWLEPSQVACARGAHMRMQRVVLHFCLQPSRQPDMARFFPRPISNSNNLLMNDVFSLESYSHNLEPQKNSTGSLLGL